MLSALQEQKRIYDQFKGKYFFCSETGNMIDPSNLRKWVWIPILEKFSHTDFHTEIADLALSLIR
jgi:hypothetical protein